jgi:hypothetical protein
VAENWKGEAYAVTPDGDYVLGFEYGQSSYDWSDPNYDPNLFSSAYVRNPDGSFSQLLPPPTGYPGDNWTPIAISNDGNVAVGRYGWWIYSFPVMWIRGAGTQDFQLFLVSQGLDELWFWQLSNLPVVTPDGTKVAGAGYNPDGWMEGFIVDISKVKVCHAPPGNPENERTLSISLDSVADHIGHGDFLGTCEFKNSGALSRAAGLHPERPADQGRSPDTNSVIPTEQQAEEMGNVFGAEPVGEQPQRRQMGQRTHAQRTR